MSTPYFIRSEPFLATSSACENAMCRFLHDAVLVLRGVVLDGQTPMAVELSPVNLRQRSIRGVDA